MGLGAGHASELPIRAKHSPQPLLSSSPALLQAHLPQSNWEYSPALGERKKKRRLEVNSALLQRGAGLEHARL